MRSSLVSIALLSCSCFAATACSVEATSTEDGTSPPSGTTAPPPSASGTTPTPPQEEQPPAPIETEWSKVTVPAKVRVTGLSASSATDAWAVGSDATTSNKGIVLRFDGMSWSEVTMPKALSRIDAVYAAAKDAVFVVSSYPGTVYGYDGASWKEFPFSVTNAYSIFGTGKDDVWLGTQWNFSSGPLYRFDGSKWTKQALTGQTGVLGIWGSSSKDVWVRRDGLEHYDGSSWTTSDLDAEIADVYGSAKNDVWAVGKAGFISHYDGTKWTTVTSGSTSDLSTVWASGPNDAWAGGAKALLHWDGKAWSAATEGGAPSGVGRLRGSGQADAWAIDATGDFYHLTAKKK